MLWPAVGSSLEDRIMKTLLASSLGSLEEFIFLWLQDWCAGFLLAVSWRPPLAPRGRPQVLAAGHHPTGHWDLQPAKSVLAKRVSPYHRSWKDVLPALPCSIASNTSQPPPHPNSGEEMIQGMNTRRQGHGSHPRVCLPRLLFSLHLMESCMHRPMCHLP